VFLFMMYGILIIKYIKVSKSSKDIFGSVLCIGVVSSMLFSIYQNVGMTIGLAPISGITLPFMSYGGSSMITNFMALGLVLNVGMRRKKINF
jgi:rod shape determining protein RodA